MKYSKRQIQEAIKYWKNVLSDKRVIPYRLSDEIFQQRQVSASDLGPVTHNIIYSSNSMRSALKNESVEYMSEADMMTYPVAKLTAAVCREISKSLHVMTIVNDFECGKCFTISDDGKLTAGNGRISDRHVKCSIRYYDISEDFDDSKDIPGNVIYVINGDFGEDQFKACLSRLIKAGRWCGYNYIYSRYNDKAFQVSFEPLFNETDLDIGDTLYHIAPSILDEKICKNGLVPKSKSFAGTTKMEHPDRVYFFTEYDFEVMKNFAEQIYRKFITYDRLTHSFAGVTEFSVFEIDRFKLKNYNLYRDSLFDNEDPKKPIAVYTYSNIPPSAITKIETIDLND